MRSVGGFQLDVLVVPGLQPARRVVGWVESNETDQRLASWDKFMARWPRHVWTSIFTYGTVFVLFPLLCLLAYAWVSGWIF
jgi:hypothetical protein